MSEQLFAVPIYGSEIGLHLHQGQGRFRQPRAYGGTKFG
jgi:hypothetical protein